jgi:hypothetical protein
MRILLDCQADPRENRDLVGEGRWQVFGRTSLASPATVGRLERLLTAAANVAIIAVAAVIGVVAFKGGNQRSLALPQGSLAVGVRFSLPMGLKPLPRATTTLFLVLSARCHYCTESAPFYRQLAEAVMADPNGRRLVAIFPEATTEGQIFLEGMGVAVQDAVQLADLRTLGVAATPVLVMTNSEGIVTGVWGGKLSREAEQRVLVAFKAKPLL